MGLMSYLKRKIRNNIAAGVIADINAKRIFEDDMISGKGLFNNRCHNNSVQIAYDDYCDIVECVAITETEVILHYINIKNGKYQDNTLGWQYKYVDYYILREIDKNDYPKIGNILVKNKSALAIKYSTGFYRLLVKVLDFKI